MAASSNPLTPTTLVCVVTVAEPLGERLTTFVAAPGPEAAWRPVQILSLRPPFPFGIAVAEPSRKRLTAFVAAPGPPLQRDARVAASSNPLSPTNRIRKLRRIVTVPSYRSYTGQRIRSNQDFRDALKALGIGTVHLPKRFSSNVASYRLTSHNDMNSATELPIGRGSLVLEIERNVSR